MSLANRSRPNFSALHGCFHRAGTTACTRRKARRLSGEQRPVPELVGVSYNGSQSSPKGHNLHPVRSHDIFRLISQIRFQRSGGEPVAGAIRRDRILPVCRQNRVSQGKRPYGRPRRKKARRGRSSRLHSEAKLGKLSPVICFLENKKPRRSPFLAPAGSD